jgi:hypothetical protein
MLTLRSVIALGIASLAVACTTDAPREITFVESAPMKTLQSSPYEISAWPWLRNISRADIHAIETLVAQHREIRKPILRMWVVKNNRLQVVTGRDEHRGDIYNCFHVVQHDGQWHIEESRIEDLRATEEHAELVRGQAGI